MTWAILSVRRQTRTLKTFGKWQNIKSHCPLPDAAHRWFPTGPPCTPLSRKPGWYMSPTSWWLRVLLSGLRIFPHSYAEFIARRLLGRSSCSRSWQTGPRWAYLHPSSMPPMPQGDSRERRERIPRGSSFSPLADSQRSAFWFMRLLAPKQAAFKTECSAGQAWCLCFQTNLRS